MNISTGHSLKRWQAPTRYAQSGDLPIDNNPVEKAIRPIAIGKKNWLFAGSERAGKRAANIQSLLATATQPTALSHTLGCSKPWKRCLPA